MASSTAVQTPAGRAVARKPAGFLSPWALHPVILQCGVWLAVLVLYLVRFSAMLQVPTARAVTVALYIILPFCAMATGVHIWAHTWGWQRDRSLQTARSGTGTRWELRLFALWALASAVEIAYSRGVPLATSLLHLATGPETYSFGIKSLHGLLNSLSTALGLVGVERYLTTRRSSYLLLTLVTFGWAIVEIDRQIPVMLALEIAVLFVRFRRVRGRAVLMAVVIALVMIIGFGMIGDLRSGRQVFYALAEPTSAFPAWLPSGFLWVYIYVVTPFNNLLFNIATRRPMQDWHLYHTLWTLVPSVLRDALRPGLAIPGVSLVVANFNVSTAYVNIYLDVGLRGVVVLSAGIGLACEFCWLRNTRRAVVLYAVIAVLLLLGIFTPTFLFPADSFQLFWLWLIYAPQRQALVVGPGPERLALRSAGFRTAL